MKMERFHIRYTAWLEGARIPVHGEFDLPAKDKQDAIECCAIRWPEMDIQQIDLVR